jgi:hypothetical protein
MQSSYIRLRLMCRCAQSAGPAFDAGCLCVTKATMTDIFEAASPGRVRTCLSASIDGGWAPRLCCGPAWKTGPCSESPLFAREATGELLTRLFERSRFLPAVTVPSG